MARTVLNPIMVEGYNTPCASEIGAGEVVTSEGAELTVAQDHLPGLLLVLENADADPRTATIKAGNGIQGVGDLEMEIPSANRVCIIPETGRFKNLFGNDKGKIIITAEGNVTARAYLLPLK